MKKKIVLLLSLLMMMSLSACQDRSDQADAAQSGGTDSAAGAGAEETDPEEAAAQETAPEETDAQGAGAADQAGASGEGQGSGILIAYFSYGENAELSNDVDASSSASIQIYNGEVTGNTGVMAHMIAEASGGELFSIRTEEPYPDNYDDTIDVGRTEKDDGSRPGLSTHIQDLGQYDTVFVGFPNWWYGMPMALYSFFDEYDLSGKTVIPFCTSGGSAFSDAIEEIKALEPGAEVLDGLHIGASGIDDAKGSVDEWVDELGLSQ